MEHTAIAPETRILDGRGGDAFEDVVATLRAEAERQCSGSSYATGIRAYVAVASSDGRGDDVLGGHVIELDVRPGVSNMPVLDTVHCATCGEDNAVYCRHLRDFITDRAA